MPLAGGFILAGVLISIVLIMARQRPSNGRPVAALPPNPVGPDQDIVTNIITEQAAPAEDRQQAPQATTEAIEAIEQGKQTGKPPPPETLAKGVEAAKQAGLPQTADAIAKEQDRTLTEVVPALISSPDVPPEPIPVDPKSKKKLWFIDVRGKSKIKMAIPNFKPTLESFKALQRAIGGIKVDGRIGIETLSAFQRKANALGFTHFPDDVEHLAANSLKWTEVLKKHFQPGQVGRPFDVPSRQWREFVARASMDWDKLAPVIEEKLGRFIGEEIDGEEVTLSGLFGLVNRAGLRGAERWLLSQNDRGKYPATTRAFQITNGIF